MPTRFSGLGWGVRGAQRFSPRADHRGAAGGLHSPAIPGTVPRRPRPGFGRFRDDADRAYTPSRDRPSRNIGTESHAYAEFLICQGIMSVRGTRNGQLLGS